MREFFQELERDVGTVSFPDQEDREVRLSSFLGRVLVISGGGRGAAEEARRWGEALALACRSREGVDYLGAGYIGKLPPLVPRRLVREMIKKQTQDPILVLWDARAAQEFGFADTDTPHVFVVDQAGVMRLRAGGPFSQEQLQQVLVTVDGLLA